MGVFHSKRRDGGSRPPRSQKREVTDADRAVLSLKTQRRKLTAERQRLEGLVSKGIAEAKQYIRNQRRERALLALRKNKLHEQSLNKIEAYLLNVEEVLSNIENAQRNNRLYSALAEGNTALAALQKEVSLEDVEKLNEETAVAAEYQERLRELLSETLSAEDDAAALEELEQIQAAQEAEEAANLPAVPATKLEPEAAPQLDLPAVPQHKIEEPAAQPQKQSSGQQRQAVPAS